MNYGNQACPICGKPAGWQQGQLDRSAMLGNRKIGAPVGKSQSDAPVSGFCLLFGFTEAGSVCYIIR